MDKLQVCIAALRSIASEWQNIDGKKYYTLAAIRARKTLEEIGHDDFLCGTRGVLKPTDEGSK